MGWDEALHPRGQHGKWTHGHGGGRPGAGLAGKVADRAGHVDVTHTGHGKLTDDQFHARAARVEHVIGGARATHSTDVTHTHPGGGWAAERDRAHREIADAIYAKHAHVPNEGRAVIAGGLGGAGKTTVLTKHAGVDTSKYLTINPDDIKEELASRGMVPEVAGHPDLSPMERAALVHEESSRIAQLVADKAYRDRKNVIWDITMSSEKSVASRVKAMRGAGYGHVHGIFVDIPTEVSVTRAMARYRRGVDSFHAGKGHGGRYVPPSIIRAQQTSSGRTVNREVFDKLKTAGAFDAHAVYDNSVDGRAPQLVEKGGRAS